MWPAGIVRYLRTRLPPGYFAAPTDHLGSRIEVNVAAFENDDAPRLRTSEGQTSLATAAWAPPEPSVAVVTDVPDYDDFEVRIHTFDEEQVRQLVAAIEFVSPSNKDRRENRNALVGKCAALLRTGVAVSIIDMVTTRQFNLYAELLQFIGHSDATLGELPPHIYAVSCSWRPHDERMLLQTWTHELAVGQPLPTLPLWLTDRIAVPLDLEPSYEEACRDLWIE